MKYITYRLVLLLFLTTILTADTITFSDEEKLYLSHHPTIKISNELDWYPYDFNENGYAKGYAIDYIKLLSKKTGLKIEFVTDTWSNLKKKFDNKEIDILQPASKNKQRKKIAIFSAPFIQMKLSLITKSKNKDIKSLEDMQGKTLALVKGWASSKYIKTHYKNIRYVEYATSKDTLEAVAFGIADATIEDFFTANYIMRKEMFNNLKVASKVYENGKDGHNLYLMFHKDAKILQSILNKALTNITQEDILNISSKWIKPIPSSHTKEIFFNQKEKQYLQEKSQINMCIDPNWMPLEMIKYGKHVGMTSDYMEMIEKEIKIPIKLVKTKTWAESIKFAKQRRCDIFSLAMQTPSRLKYMNFTKPYLKIPLVLVSTLDESFYVDVSNIKDQKIGIVKDYAFSEILRTRYPNLNIVDVEDIDDGLKKVENGDIFGFIGTLATVAYKIQKDYYGSLKIIGKFDEQWELGIGTRNDEPLLLSIMEKAIDSINPNEHQNILNKWISVKYDKKHDYTYLYKYGIILLVVLLFLLYRDYQLRKYNKKLEILSNTDKLTGIYNRLKLDEVMEYEKKLFDRHHRPLSIIILDIDDFKKINDTYGHKIGDRVLQDISQLLLSLKRQTDTVGRWGGEEFLVICNETDLNGVFALAEKFRKAIEEFDFKEVGPLTASFGVGEFEKDDSIENLFIKADKGLYLAKTMGKNRIKS